MLTTNPLQIDQPEQDRNDYESQESKRSHVNQYIEDTVDPLTGDDDLSPLELELRRQLRVIRNAIVNEADYTATLTYNEADRDIKLGFAKRGFTRKPDLLNRNIRLELEKYSAAIKQAFMAAYDTINQLILQRYETGLNNQFESVLTLFNQQKINIDKDTKQLKLSANKEFSAYIEQLSLKNRLDNNDIDQLYKFMSQEVNAGATTQQRLEQISQGYQTDMAALGISLGADKAIQGIELAADATVKQTDFSYDKTTRALVNQANIDTSIAEANAENEFSTNEMNARIGGALQKQAARLAAATNENAAKVINLSDVSTARLNVGIATNTARLDATALVNAKKTDAYIKLANARLLNLSAESTAELSAVIDRNSATLSAQSATQTARVDGIRLTNEARVSNLIAKSNNDLTLQQAALTAKLSNIGNEQTVSLAAISDLNTAQQLATSTKVSNAETRATDRSSTVRDASLLRNESRYSNLYAKINALAANRLLVNDAELSALVSEYQSRLSAIQIKGQGRLDSSQIVSLAQLSNDIAIANATLQARKDTNAATLLSDSNYITATQRAANIRLQANSATGIIAEATSAQNRMATAATQENIDLFNAYTASQISVMNNVQTSTTYDITVV